MFVPSRRWRLEYHNLQKKTVILTNTEKETADVLNIFFQSVFTVESIREQEIKLVCMNQVHPYVLRECCEEMAVPLFMIFKKSLDEGRIPEDWKMARVSPISRKAPQNQAWNYRPVNLTSVPCKVMESLLRDIILKHVMENNLLSEDQHGFSKGSHACLTYSSPCRMWQRVSMEVFV